MTEETSEQALLKEPRGAVLWLWLNRPQRLNAVSEGMYEALVAALAEAPQQECRAVVLAGKGRAFCSGADLKAHEEGRTPDQARTYVALAQRACGAVQDSPLPVVAAVHGYALGAGAELALSADFVVVTEDAQLGFPELSIGTYVGGGITARLPRLVGMARARELLFLGERISGATAAAWGLVHAAVTSDELLEAAADLARRLADKAPLPVAFAKRHLAAGGSTPEEAMAQEAEALLACMETEDWAEGVRAFADKRPPRFRGR